MNSNKHRTTMDPIIDWQISRHEIKARGQYLLETGKWADCHFLVGSEPHQQLLAGHKLILAMASPVFEAMFYGGLPEKNDPIAILDVQPEAFKSLLEYIYTDKINILSVDKACELCYGAKKYMLPFVVEQCTKFLWSDLCPKNACRAFEFAKLFEEPRLQEKCLQIICTKTLDVIQDSSFDDVELSTVITILDQDVLNIDSEIDLFFAVNRFAEKHGLINQSQNNQERSASALLANNDPPMEPQIPNTNNDVAALDEIIDADAGPEPSSSTQQAPSPAASTSSSTSRQQQESLSIKNAIKKIRFLTLTPQQFAEGPARTNLLTQSEAFAILMNISTSNSVYPMPEGFTQNKNPRSDQQRVGGYPFVDSETPSPIQSVPVVQVLPLPESPHHHLAGGGASVHHGSYMDELRNEQKFYCMRIIRQQTECLNTSVLDCSLTFTVDRSICVTGVQVPTQVLGGIILDPNNGVPDRYSELLYAHLLDSQGSRLTYTHCTQRVRYNSLLEISFDRPVFIQRHKMYKVCVVFNKVGWYPMCTCFPTVTCDNVCFTFGVGSQSESVRDGLIRSIIFTYSREGQSGVIGLP